MKTPMNPAPNKTWTCACRPNACFLCPQCGAARYVGMKARRLAFKAAAAAKKRA
jgi:hypothetical protein